MSGGLAISKCWEVFWKSGRQVENRSGHLDFRRQSAAPWGRLERPPGRTYWEQLQNLHLKHGESPRRRTRCWRGSRGGQGSPPRCKKRRERIKSLPAFFCRCELQFAIITGWCLLLNPQRPFVRRASSGCPRLSSSKLPRRIPCHDSHRPRAGYHSCRFFSPRTSNYRQG